MARVLVVDDDPDLRMLVQFQLQQHGHLVLIAAGGEEAIELIKQRGAPDVAVLDVAMPGMSGIELLSALRALEGMSKLPAIFLSARIAPEDIRAGEEQDAVYLTKPYVMNALLSAIDRIASATVTW